jgi:hypothetical protein
MEYLASVRNRSSSKVKTVKPSIELEDCVILLNCISDLIEQKGTRFVFSAVMKITENKVIKINGRKMLGMSFAR